MTVIWAVEAKPFMQYDGTNGGDIVDWLDGLGADGRHWNASQGSNPAVTITSESDGVLDLHFFSGNGAATGVELFSTLNAGDWICSNSAVVSDARFAESFVVKG